MHEKPSKFIPRKGNAGVTIGRIKEGANLFIATNPMPGRKHKGETNQSKGSNGKPRNPQSYLVQENPGTEKH